MTANFFFSPTFEGIPSPGPGEIYYASITPFRRMNELKLDIDIPDDVVQKFKLFWSDFKDTPLRGRGCC